jgi:hypothetical protein
MRRVPFPIPLLFAAVFLGAPFAGVGAEPFSGTLAGDLRPEIVTVGGKILILSPEALVRFQPDTEAWTTTTAAEGLPNRPLTGLAFTAGQIWITGQGAAFSDPRFDDWQRYLPGEGIPGRTVLGIEADNDFAYAATDSGAARFDSYTLEWETIRDATGRPLGPANDLAVTDDRVWFALERGVAEYRKESESLQLDTDLGGIAAPRVLALRQTTRFLWAVTAQGLSRYDKLLRTWTSFRAGIDLPDARIHQISIDGEDVWLGTDDGPWRYRADVGIWRRHESADQMPGRQVRAFALEPDRIWVMTEVAFALYEKESARWLDFSADVPLAPPEARQIAWTSGCLVLLGANRVVVGLPQGERNPSLFIYRSQSIPRAGADGGPGAERWRADLDPSGLGVTDPQGRSLRVKGGATIFIEKGEGADLTGSPLSDLASEARLDLTLAGRFGDDRVLNGFYDTTDPENAAYQLTYRGNREDLLRSLSLGEIEQETYNAALTPGTGLKGGSARIEMGSRSEATRRRWLTADGWAGRRRTAPGRDVFNGRNHLVSGTVRDVDYVRMSVFPTPAGWTSDDLRGATYYIDDARESTDNANTEHRTLAGRPGAYDRLSPNRQYVIGPAGATLILLSPMSEGQALIGVRTAPGLDPATAESNLTDRWLRNHYAIATDPIPGSLALSIIDSTGASSDPTGSPYLRVFGLDQDGDGLLDPDRFSPISGMLSFPDSLPFLPDVYAEDASHHRIDYRYETRLNTFRLSHHNLVPGSERILIDRELVRPNIDYSIIYSSGLVVFFEQVAIDEDAVIEVEYEYEVDDATASATGGEGDRPVLGGQVGVAPDDHLFLGLNGTRWEENRAEAVTADLNGRIEWKSDVSLLRVMPEIAVSRASGGAEPASSSGETSSGPVTDLATGIGLQGRYRAVEISGSHRNLGSRFVSFEDRRTLTGRLTQESRAHGRVDLTKQIQGEVDWDQSLSEAEGVGGNGEGRGRGETSSLIATARILRSSLPNLELRRGRVILETPDQRQEKWISRADVEIDLLEAGAAPIGIQRFTLHSFYQRSDRRFGSGGGDEDTIAAPRTNPTIHDLCAGKAVVRPAGAVRSTDHAFVRINGAVGAPFAWDAAFEDQWTHRPRKEGPENLRRLQKADATFQSQPHSSLDAFLRWESSRDLSWGPNGGGGGFTVRRVGLATLHLYPGRVVERLTPLSFRFDLIRSETDDGEPGTPLPDAGSLMSPVSDPTMQTRSGNGVVEGRYQINTWARLIERWDEESQRAAREGLETHDRRRELESRLEMKPTAGLVTLRGIFSRAETDGAGDDTRRRFHGEWDQTWGGGILTYAAFEGERVEREDWNEGDLTHRLNPQARVTWRRSRWQLDATLGGGLTWTRTKGTSVGTSGGWIESRQQSLNASLSMQPLRLLTLKVDYELARSGGGSVSSADSSERGVVAAQRLWMATGPTALSRWRTEQEIRVRLLLRA